MATVDGPELDVDEVLAVVQRLYSSLDAKLRPPDGQYTVLAAFVLWNAASRALKVISLSTGLKCLPAARLPPAGDALHDSHAEILARRGAVRWFLEEVGRGPGDGRVSDWIEETTTTMTRSFSLKEGVCIVMYVSTVPCGDASTRYLAAFQDEEMASLKDSALRPTSLSPGTAARGRDNYALYSVLRTKPGRADSPPTSCMSCSDKIASWSVLGFQGALASSLFTPLYISAFIFGDVTLTMHDIIREDCLRALWKRVEVGRFQELPIGYRLHQPQIHLTSESFQHSRTWFGPRASAPCNESLCWIADSAKPPEVLINGRRRGVPPKHHHTERFQPQLCKMSLFRLFMRTRILLGWPQDADPVIYFTLKQSMTQYQEVKNRLMGHGAPFSGWIRNGVRWESFDEMTGQCQDSHLV